VGQREPEKKKLRPKMLLVMGSLVASLLAMGLAAAPALGQEAVEARAGDDVVARGAPTPAIEELGPLDAPAERQPIPDLVVRPSQSSQSFCASQGDTSLLVYTRNIGFGDAPETTTEVEFDFFDGSETTREIRIPDRPPFAGAQWELVALPNRAVEGQGYTVTVTADLHDEAAELDELNNFAFEVCPPGFGRL
jgi:hypothetical protein